MLGGQIGQRGKGIRPFSPLSGGRIAGPPPTGKDQEPATQSEGSEARADEGEGVGTGPGEDATEDAGVVGRRRRLGAGLTEDVVAGRHTSAGVVAGVLVARRDTGIRRYLGQDDRHDLRRRGIGVLLLRQDGVGILPVLRRRHVTRFRGRRGRRLRLPTGPGRRRDDHGGRAGKEHGKRQFSDFVAHGSPAFALYPAWYSQRSMTGPRGPVTSYSTGSPRII